MKTKNNFNKIIPVKWITKSLVKSMALVALTITGTQTPLMAQQDSVTPPSWWFGLAGGANFNFYRGSTQKLNSELTVPTAFHNGNGIGLFAAPLVEFHRPSSKWGGMLQAGYDGRSGTFNQIKTPCNCPTDLSTKLSYITVEPSLRFAPFKKGLYFYAGPRFAYNLDKSFTYHQKTNSDYPEQVQNPEVKGNLSDVNPLLVSLQVGAGYDIALSNKSSLSQFVLSPFISFQPYFGQSPRSIETWNITTVRTGVAVKFGRGHKHSSDTTNKLAGDAKTNTPADASADSKVMFTVNSPKNIPVERRVRETFPLRNYVFFDLGSTVIPDRYVLLKKSEVKDFKEEQLEVFKPKTLSGRSKRQMVAYYNILNILGDRMQKKPTTTIVLSGSSEQGQEDGKAMAESVKKYFVDVFEIDPSRIKTEGNDKPKVPSGVSGGTQDLVLLSEGNRRVTIETTSPTLLMEFQSGPDAPLKPVEILDVQEAPLDSYVTFNADGGKDAFVSWSLEITDEKGTMQKFGPYTQKSVSIPGKSILGDRAQDDFKVVMIGITAKGKTVKKDADVHMVLWTPPTNEEGMRFSVIFEYNQSKATGIYEKYLTNIVTPKIPKDGTVIIHGYTDVIGDPDHNQKLSLARAQDVKNILEASLKKEGKSDVKIEIYGFGEDEKLAPFENKYPEGRFYNRSVVIDIIPKN
ncbi:MAG: outer membrane beta-barrel protein [Bacteroidia bacterium]